MRQAGFCAEFMPATTFALHLRVLNVTTTREAKEFLIAQIIAEAEQSGHPLDDIERRMLYYTETAWMPEDTWDASETFDRDYDRDEYERHIGHLTTSLKQRPNHDADSWAAAVHLLNTEDHYLLILIEPSKYETSATEDITRWKKKFLLGSLGVALVIFLAALLVHAFFVVFPR